jgi:hypothetical protein
MSAPEDLSQALGNGRELRMLIQRGNRLLMLQASQ